MKLIKEFTRQCCNAFWGVSCWSGAVSEVVEVVAHKVCASVCGQDTTISQEKILCSSGSATLQKASCHVGPQNVYGFAYSSFSTETEVLWHQSCEGFPVITALLFALVFPGKFTQKIHEYVKYIQVKTVKFLKTSIIIYYCYYYCCCYYFVIQLV